VASEALVNQDEIGAKLERESQSFGFAGVEPGGGYGFGN